MSDESGLERTLSLAREAKAGNKLAESRFFERYRMRLMHVVSLRMGKRLGDFVEVEDVVQEALVRCLASFESLELRSQGQLRNWMATVATNAVRSTARTLAADKRDFRRLRGLPGSEEGENAELAVRGASPSQEVAARELSEQLEAALLELEPRQLEVFDLVQLCGMSTAEAAERMGIAESSVRAHKARCLARLSSKLEVEDRLET